MLLQITQNFGESSSDYVTRFEEQCSTTNQSTVTDDPTTLGAFIEGIEDGELRIQMETCTYSTFEKLQVNLRKWEDVVRRKEAR
uniref:Retrotransposon gag domain-containing protein n=1 Tax=Chromera velia CCMP2878 TaxID=1169474 RepID=A0A0G4FK93_9ALVE|eukprot:Cvel_17464.t1-p1 / transcript=Cvel_17464.t1 / gene=Cvel_17464 / organism=Chromera_velia_CCMP2878 / gene_product=hypothetical protein / transcript_product=hypothetical protein / location=Cvel_scaffold1395:11039-11287(+) / protein_length=83 / sequence_SO=supercontig / SO=protein_coding / is_pseudo=false